MAFKDFLPEDSKFSTLAIHGTRFLNERISKPVVSPIVLSTTYKQLVLDKDQPYSYGRIDNPMREILETNIANLEGGKYGLTFSSGLAALNAVVHLLNAGDHVICTNHVYGETDLYFNKMASKFRIDVSFVDLGFVRNLETEMKPNTKLIWLENPTNPMMNVVDIKAISLYAKSKNPDVIVAVDNTFLTSYFQKPLELGADISVYSLTKYMNGHTDVVMGATVTDNESIYSELKFMQCVCGGIPSPFDCYLVDRGLKTLSIRMKQHMENGLRIARYLESQPMVLEVQHPGLKSHPRYEMAKQQWSGYSSMMSFYFNGHLGDVQLFVNKLKYFICATSLGGFESLISVPSLSSHSVVSPCVREKLGISDNLVRLSVGLESADDLVEDLNQAFLAVQVARKNGVVRP